MKYIITNLKLYTQILYESYKVTYTMVSDSG